MVYERDLASSDETLQVALSESFRLNRTLVLPDDDQFVFCPLGFLSLLPSLETTCLLSFVLLPLASLRTFILDPPSIPSIPSIPLFSEDFVQLGGGTRILIVDREGFRVISK